MQASNGSFKLKDKKAGALVKTSLAQDGYSKSLFQKEPEEILKEEFGERYLEYRKRWHAAQKFEMRPLFPIHLDLETTYACNIKCVMCPFGDPTYHHPPYKGSRLDMGVIKDLIREGVPLGLRAVRFNVLTEPLLIKKLPDMVRFARESGVIDIFMTTNGMLLTEKKSQELISAGITHLMISLDAATAETYAVIRKGGDYTTVVKNIERFLAIRLEMGKRLPLLRLSFSKMKPNAGEVDAFIKQWKGKVDYILIAGYIDNIHDKEKSAALAITPPRVTGKKSFHCWQPWVRCTVFANGDVFPCCMNYGRPAPVGNVYKERLADIWQSSQVKFIQDISKKGQFMKHPVCRECVSKRDFFES
jgi:radical SAM protein with 4Fe4S-binding SPASM domain